MCARSEHDREVLELDADAEADMPGRLWAKWHRRSLSESNLAFLASFPRSRVVRSPGMDYLDDEP